MSSFVELSIDREDMPGSLPPLLIASDRSTALVLTSYTEPSLVPVIGYAPSSAYVHGELPMAWRFAQTGLAFTVGAPDADAEDEARAAIDELSLALYRGDYPLTETIGNSVRIWRCLPGAITPAGPRTYRNLRAHQPQWQINIPAYPLPS
jgi:hypothetical protein